MKKASKIILTSVLTIALSLFLVPNLFAEGDLAPFQLDTPYDMGFMLAKGGGDGGDGGSGGGACKRRNGQPVGCLTCPNTNNNGGGQNQTQACGNGSSIFTQSEFTAFVAAQKRAAIASAANFDGFHDGNKGFKLGFNSFLQEIADKRKNANGNFSFSKSEINRAKANAARVGQVFTSKVAQLKAKIKSDIQFNDPASAAFFKALDEGLIEDDFIAVLTTDDEGRKRLNVELSENVLRTQLRNALEQSFTKDPEVINAAVAELEIKRAELLAAKSGGLPDSADELRQLCSQLAQNGGRQISSSDGPQSFNLSVGGAGNGTGSSSTNIINGSVGIGGVPNGNGGGSSGTAATGTNSIGTAVGISGNTSN